MISAISSGRVRAGFARVDSAFAYGSHSVGSTAGSLLTEAAWLFSKLDERPERAAEMPIRVDDDGTYIADDCRSRSAALAATTRSSVAAIGAQAHDSLVTAITAPLACARPRSPSSHSTPMSPAR